VREHTLVEAEHRCDLGNGGPVDPHAQDRQIVRVEPVDRALVDRRSQRWQRRTRLRRRSEMAAKSFSCGLAAADGRMVVDDERADHGSTSPRRIA
jgi:hypothetical protein